MEYYLYISNTVYFFYTRHIMTMMKRGVDNDNDNDNDNKNKNNKKQRLNNDYGDQHPFNRENYLKFVISSDDTIKYMIMMAYFNNFNDIVLQIISKLLLVNVRIQVDKFKLNDHLNNLDHFEEPYESKSYDLCYINHCMTMGYFIRVLFYEYIKLVSNSDIFISFCIDGPLMYNPSPLLIINHNNPNRFGQTILNMINNGNTYGNSNEKTLDSPLYTYEKGLISPTISFKFELYYNVKDSNRYLLDYF